MRVRVESNNMERIYSFNELRRLCRSFKVYRVQGQLQCIALARKSGLDISDGIHIVDIETRKKKPLQKQYIEMQNGRFNSKYNVAKNSLVIKEITDEEVAGKLRYKLYILNT